MKVKEILSYHINEDFGVIYIDFILEEIFDLNGEFVDFSDDEIQTLSWSWDGRNQRGEIVPFGVYILYFIANSGEISQKETVVVVN